MLCVIYSSYFQDFFFVLIFISFIIVYLIMAFFELILFEILWASLICHFLSFAKLRKFLAINFVNNF